MNVQNKIKLALETFFNAHWDEQDFLTEDDVRCRLFYFLHAELYNDKTASIHSEVRWYGNTGGNMLKYRSDIVIIDKQDLVTTDHLFELPSKGYGFNKYYSIIEIKLRRSNCKSTKSKHNEIIQKDIEKLLEIKNKTIEYEIEGEKEYFVIAFDKKEKEKLLLNINESDQYNNIAWQKWDIS